MRKVFWWCSAGMAVIAGLAFYCWCCPDSMLGRCASAVYDFSCQANPVYVLSRQVVRGDAPKHQDAEVMGDDALAQAKEDPKPCEEEEHAPRSVPVVPLGGVVELPAPIVIKDDEQPKSPLLGAAAGALGIDPALAMAMFQNQGGADANPRPMPYAKDAETAAPPERPMPYAEEDETPAAPERPMPYAAKDAEEPAAPERPMPHADEGEMSTGYAPPDTQLPIPMDGSPRMSGCPFCPTVKEPEASAPKSEGENGEQPKAPKAKKKHVKKSSWWSSNYEREIHPRQPDIDTMEFGPRDRRLYEFGPGPI